MPQGFEQANRLIAVDTPLGADRLTLRSFTGTEAISQLFRFQLEMTSDDPEINFDQIVGQQVTVRVTLADGSSKRYFNGHVSRFTQLPGEERLAHYQAVVVPWLWFLTRTADCRIFQEKTVPEIIKQVFGDFGFHDFEDQTQGHYDTWDYCVQYRETACDFVMRLMEQEGIFFFFRHEESKHVLVMGDAPSAHKPCPNQPSVSSERVTGPGYDRENDVILRWEYRQKLRTGKYASTDYNFETPGTSLLAKLDSSINQGGNQRYEVFDYPGEYEKRNQGETQVRLRIEEQELSHIVVHGDGNCRDFSAGLRFDLTDHERQDQNGPYVLTSVTHKAHSGTFYTGQLEEGAVYANNFTCIPHSVPFRPPRTTAKHLVQGPQTAVVVGPGGEEIYTDKYGRVKVQFHWDRRGNADEKSSCWMRVSQPWAGKNWGGMWIPRIGQEVVVSFLEGDPDRPIITGRVYNAEEMPPYKLPDNQTMSTMKSRSSKGGGGFNELRFEDKKDKEQVFIHAERNMDVRVKKDRFETVIADSHLGVGGDQLEEISGDRHLHVKGDQNQKVDGTVSMNAGMDMQEKAGMNYALESGMDMHLKAGMNVVIEAPVTLTLKCGSNFVSLNPAGVFITGTMVMINSGGSPGTGAGSSPQAPKAPTEADNAEPGGKSAPPPKPPGVKPVPPPEPGSYSPAAAVLKQSAQSGVPFCEICSRT
jgi:type VI secretion system secreted protein VgrG